MKLFGNVYLSAQGRATPECSRSRRAICSPADYLSDPKVLEHAPIEQELIWSKSAPGAVFMQLPKGFSTYSEDSWRRLEIVIPSIYSND